MKKFLLSAVACMAVASAASATDLYIRGGNFGWGAGDCTEANHFTDLGDGNFTLTLETLSSGFKIADSNWGADNWGSASDIELDQEYTLSCGPTSGNISTKGGADFKDVTIHFNNVTGVLKCTGKSVAVDWSTVNMFLVGDDFGWDEAAPKLTWADGKFTVTVEAINGMFKISDAGTWKYHFGDNCEIKGNAAEKVEAAGNDFHLAPIDGLKNVTLSLDPEAKVLTIDENAASINTVEAAAAAAPAVYFNLQGQRVANPEAGLFIRLQNGKATKVAL